MSQRVIADSCIWIDHIDHRDDALVGLLRRGRVLVHEIIIGEIALGTGPRRDAATAELRALPRVRTQPLDAILESIARYELAGLGVGLVDIHLLASALLTPETMLWTRDKRLGREAERLGVAFAG